MNQDFLGDTEKRRAGSETASLELLVSIYLLLLAFFVVLNNISNQRVAKAGAVMESVNSAFDKKFAPPARVVDLFREPAEIAPNEEFIDEAEGLLESVFSLDGGFATEGGDTVRAQITLESLFVGSSPVPRDELSTFARDLIKLALAAKPGERREVEFIFGSGSEELTSQPVQKQLLAARRAGNLAQALVDQGLPPNTISTGVAAGAEDKITVRFRILDEAAASVTFASRRGTRP